MRYYLLTLLTVIALSAQADTYTIDVGQPRQTIRHFGASDAWSMQFIGCWQDEAEQRKIADWLFSTDVDAEGKPLGIGLSVWRFNLGAGSEEQGREAQISSGTRTECFLKKDGTYDWTKQAGQRKFLRMAKERGVPHFLAFLNSPPVYFTENGLATNTGRGGTLNLRDDCYDDFARFMVTSLKGIEAHDGIHFDYLCPVNEPDGHWNWQGPKQEGSPATNREIARLVRETSRELDRQGLNTQILVNESSDLRCLLDIYKTTWERGNTISTFFSQDSTATYLGQTPHVPRLIAGHSYWTNTPIPYMRQIREQLRDTLARYGLKFWQTELCIMQNDEEIGGGGGYDFSMKTALYVARVIHNDLVYADAESWSWWRAVGGDYKDGLIRVYSQDRMRTGGRAVDSRLMWALGNYSRFVRPGAVRYEMQQPDDPYGVMASAYRNVDGTWAVVAINYSDVPQDFSLATSDRQPLTWRAYRTSDVDGETLKPVEATTQLPPRSITTFVSTAQSPFSSVRQRLMNMPVQEKVYLHLDNTCYYKGDTIWYKAYVVRADSLTYTDMSRILYVELVSPDGLVVERQQIIVSDQGYSNGNFELRDSIYSGFYELRAYTRWMLNFHVSEHDYGRKDRECFYNAQMAQDFFRQFGTVYSRVVPVYERPEEPGEYAMKYIVSRPKTRLEKEQMERLVVNFYPEGGHLVTGQRCNVAFEVTNEEGEWGDIAGSVAGQPIKTEFQGRGCFTIDVPQSGLTADFRYKGKDYHFDLPKSEPDGCALRLTAGEDITATITLGARQPGMQYAAAVLCRGVLRAFQPIAPDTNGQAVVRFDQAQLPTGVCDLLILDAVGRPLADRLFFVNHHDYDQQQITVAGGDTYEPYARIQLEFQAPADAEHISIAVRDGYSDETSYDTGNMLTDLLLGSELKGFIAYPHYYFEADDAEHRRALDLLMMVQGWRRYDYTELTSDAPLRYMPETAITVEGSVYPTPSMDDYEPDEMRYWANGIFGYSPAKVDLGLMSNQQVKTIDDVVGSEVEETDNSVRKVSEKLRDLADHGGRATDGSITLDKVGTAIYVTDINGELNNTKADPNFAVSHGGLKHEVTVESELVFEDDLATLEMETTNGGHFAFSVPPYYGQAILFLKARDNDISDKKKKRLDTKGVLDEKEWPEYYVKRDLFFPVFAKKYSWYQCHLPEEESDSLSTDVNGGPVRQGERISSFDRVLKGVTVKAKRRRGRHAVDYSKPACVYDTHELYNLVTDRGLSFGRYDPQQFPLQVSMALLGNYNSERRMNVMARLNDRELTPYVYFRNYDAGPTFFGQHRSDFWIEKNLRLGRQQETRLYTDFELRNEDKHVEQASQAADVTLDLLLVPDDSRRYTYRDRRLVLNGMTEPADFYHPNYQERPLPDDFTDYRRTLYWNPNARLDSEGRFTATFYNNGKQTRIQVDAAGLTRSGHPITNNNNQ